ncbi:hypothetical protein Tco_1430999 [Tanacetum coccineum]
MKLEEEKLLEISELKKRWQEFMNSTHVKSILGKLTHTKGNHVDSMPEKTKSTVSWVKINKHRLNANDPSLAELLKKVKPGVEDLSRSACSFMLCDLDFEPLSLSLSSLPSCDLVSLTNMLILLHYLESFKSELAEVRSRAEHELELKEKLKGKYDARGRLLEEKDLEILILKSLLVEEAEKAERAETAEVVRLRDQVSALTGEVSVLKSTIAQKDTNISLLDSRATYLNSALDNSKAAYAEAGSLITSLTSERDRLTSEVSTLHTAFQDLKKKAETQQEEQAQVLYNRVAELEAHMMDVSGRLEREFYPAYLTTLAGRRWFLTHGIQLAVLKCLKSPEYQGILGHALGRAMDFGMQEGLEAGYEHGVAGTQLFAVEAYNPEAARTSYFDAVRTLEDVDFPLVNLLKSKKDVGMDEVLDCFILDGPLADLPEAAHLQPCLEQLIVPIVET